MPPKPAPRRPRESVHLGSNRKQAAGPVPLPRRHSDIFKSAKDVHDGEEFQDAEPSVKLFVNNLPKNCSQDLLTVFFESKRTFGRALCVDQVEYDSEKNEAIVIFQSSEDLATVLDKHKETPLMLSQTKIHIEEYREKQVKHLEQDIQGKPSADSDEISDSETKTVMIKGYKARRSTDTLRYYFENKTRSGGGDVESLVEDKENEYILITFEEERALRSVCDKARTQPHVVDGCQLSVKPFMYSKTDLLFTNIPEGVSEENLRNFLEAKLKVEVAQIPIAYNFSRDRAVVKFMEPLDLQFVERACKKWPFMYSNLAPMPVSLTNTILVMNLPEDVTEDTCRYYFENHKKSGGGDVEQIIFNEDEDYCLISFEDSKVVDSVCSRETHCILGTVLKVTPHHLCLGRPALPDADKPWVCPEPYITETKYKSKLKFVDSRDEHKKSADDCFFALNATVHWKQKPVVIECSLSKQVKGYKKLGKTWTENIKKELARMMAELGERLFIADEEEFPLVKKELESVHLQHPEEVAVFLEKNDYTVILVGAKDAFEDAESEIQRVFDKVKRELKQQKQRISKQETFQEWQINYLQMKNIHIQMQSKYPDVRVIMDNDECSLEFTGPRTSVTDVILDLHEKLECVRLKSIKIPREALILLGNAETQQQISKKLKRKQLLDLWESDENSLRVITEEGEDFAKKKMIFKGFYANMELQIDTSSEILRRADKWSELQQKIQHDYQGSVVIEKVENKIRLCCRKDVNLEVQQDIQQFLSKNSIISQEICIEKYVLQFMKQYMDREIGQKVQAIQRNTEVKVEYKRSDTVLVQGTADGLSGVRKLLEELKGKVKFRQFKLDRPGARQYLTSSKGQESIKSVETNTPCIIHILESTGARKSAADQGKTLQMLGLTQACAEALLPTGQRVIVFGGNMLQLKVDVIVNAANEEMKLTGGLAAAILKSGGKSIQKECSDFVKKNGSVSIGNVVVSSGGSLSCKHIVHTVGPRWQGGTNKEPELLQSVLEKCLVESDQRQCTSVAIPALCTGVYKYPIDQACLLIVTTIKQYFQNKPQSTIRLVYLCDINPKTVNEFQKALFSIDGVKQVTGQDDQKSLPAPIKDGTSQDQRPVGTMIVFGNTQVEIIKGNITDEKVDVIVNSASNDLDLGRGKASLALLKAGGSSIQADCNQKYPNGISVGEVAVTTAGDLKCKNILHICLEAYSHKKSVDYLEAYMESCLTEADKLGSQSIAFPALGTGAQNFPASIVAESMFSCVSKYCVGNKDKTSIKSVKFVVFHMDSEIHKTFMSTLQQLSTGNQDSQTSTRTSHTDISKVEKKIIKASKDSAEFQIGGIHVFVNEGDITEQDTKAIVAGSNSGLDLDKSGQVVKAILAKGGAEIGRDCEQKRPQMKSAGIVVTTAGQLKCENIIFVVAPDSVNGWEDVVYNCLKIAEGQGITSISFPALGTVIGHDPGKMAAVVAKAVCGFVAGQADQKVVQEIRIVIFQKTMLDPVINGFKSSIQGQSILKQIGQRFLGRKKLKNKTSVTTSSGTYDSVDSTQDDSTSDGMDETETTCILEIYAEGSQKVDDAFKRLKAGLDHEWYSQKIEDSAILKLDTKQLENIEAVAKKNNVQVNIDQDVGGVKIQGLINNVMPVKDLIYEELRSFDRGVHEKRHAELLTNVVKWFWITKDEQKPFDDVHNLKIEDGYKNTLAKVTLTDSRRNEDFDVDFQQMQMIYVENPAENYPVIRRDLMAKTGDTVPDSWDPMKMDQNLMMVDLPNSSKEYNDVLAEFSKTLGRTPNIIKIERIQNKTVYLQYAAKKRLMEMCNPGITNERVLWHGTDVNAVANITAHGYNRSYCGKNATVYGEGVYFAVNAQYSDRNGYARPEPNTGHKRMYRALVLVGHYTLGVQGMRVPPTRVRGTPDILYDSVTNSMQDPAMFVIFHDTQAYPEHIITYT